MSPLRSIFELNLTIRQGTVYYFQNRELTSAEPHFFIVVNANPASETVILLAVSTSKVEELKRRRAAQPGTVVEITPAEYSALRVVSAIDGNRLFPMEKAELLGKINGRHVRHHADLPANIIARLVAAVLASPLVPPAQKLLVAGQPTCSPEPHPPE